MLTLLLFCTQSYAEKLSDWPTCQNFTKCPDIFFFYLFLERSNLDRIENFEPMTNVLLQHQNEGNFHEISSIKTWKHSLDTIENWWIGRIN